MAWFFRSPCIRLTKCQTLTAPEHITREFELVYDFTSFTSVSEVPVQWLKYCCEIIPFDVRQRFIGAHILNPNALALRYLRRVYNIFAGKIFSLDSVLSFTDILYIQECPYSTTSARTRLYRSSYAFTLLPILVLPPWGTRVRAALDFLHI